MNEEFLEIPEYESLEQILDCKNCPRYRHECKPYYFIDSQISSLFDCQKLLRKISNIQLTTEIIIFVGISVFSILHFKVFWKSLLVIVPIFAFVLFCGYLVRNFFKKHYENLEAKRKKEYEEKVKQIEADNEALRRQKLNISDELYAFTESSKELLTDLTNIYNVIKTSSDLKNPNQLRVIEKFEKAIEKIGELNSIISSANYEDHEISNFYKLHLRKLFEYSNQFLDYLKENSLSETQTKDFSNLLEVVSSKAHLLFDYWKNRVESDFSVKLNALNQDIDPDYDGSEDKKDG